MAPWARFAAGYCVLTVAAVGIAWGTSERLPLVHPKPWLEFGPGLTTHAVSALAGLCVGGLVVLSTRLAVTRWAWARQLHSDLSPVARGLSLGGIALLATLSAVAEELWFRGLVQAWIGLVPQAVLFGLVHQVRGPSRLAWILWAALVGLLLGALFQLSGSLAGPLAAHALVNALNLHYLKRHQPRSRRALGGLLGQRS